MKEITLRVPDSMVPLIEEWVKHIPEIELASLEESGVYEIDEDTQGEQGNSIWLRLYLDYGSYR